MTEERQGEMPQTVGPGVHDPRAFRRFSGESATVVRMYSDEDVSIVVWNLQPGQENPPHVHPENAHALTVLEGEGCYVRADGSETPIKAGDCIVVARASMHGIRNSSAAPLSYLAVTTLGGKGYVRNVVAEGTSSDRH
jgi:quercetin dioxygenase-like cupin family protein